MYVLASLLLLSCGPKEAPLAAAAEPVAAAAIDPDAVIPTDPAVKMGVLDNGLHWYVQRNTRPEQRAELRLVVKVGSIVEDDDQLGLAHFLEHMAFNGSEHFEGNALIEYMGSIGMDFGAHLNAYTSFDRTVYMLTVPTDDPQLLDTGLLVLRDQAGALLLDPGEVEAERGVVLEEWRSRQGAGSRISDSRVAATFEGSRYADRLPIGTEESLKTFAPDSLTRFYEDWYRPELMGVIAVGDFDEATVQELIVSHFGDLENPAEPRAREAHGIPAREATIINVITDPEVPSTSFDIAEQFDDPEDVTYGGYRSLLVRNLMFFVVNERFGVIAQDPDATILGAGAGYDRINSIEASHVVGAGTPEGGEAAAMDTVLTEVARMQRHGVTQGELDRAKATLMATYERMYKERDKSYSGSEADELIRVYSSGEGMPGTEAEYGFCRDWLPTIDLDEVNAFAATWMAEGSWVVQVIAPEKEGLTPITADEIEALIAEIGDRELAAPVEDTVTGPLLDPLPADGPTVTEREAIEELGVVVWTLSNGVDVWLKPTDFQDDQIVLRASSLGGVSTVPDGDYVAASTAASIAGRSGLGTFDAASLGKRLQGIRAGAGASVGRFGESVSGSAPPEELEILLQLVTLRMTQPRFSEDGLANYRRGKVEGLRNRLSDPNAVFGDQWSALTWNDSPRAQPWTVETLDQLDLAKSQAFYEGRFANAADFTWMLVGNLDLDAMEPLIVRYLGNLPTTEEREEYGVDGLERLGEDASFEVRAGLEPKARVKLQWSGPFESSWLSRNRLQATEDILSERLRGVLREDLGGVYGVGVSSSTWERPEGGYSVNIGFSCDPDRVEELVAAVQTEVDRIRTEAVSAEEIANEQEKNRRDREERIRTNGFWVSAVLGTLERGEDPRDLMTWDARNDSLSAEEVLATAEQVFADEAALVQGVLMPEAPAE